MNEFLKARTFGMPRWAFLVLLAGGIVLGLYLRNRRRAQAAAQEPSPTEGTDTLANADGEAGLAGVGVASPPGGVYPVTTPTVPEGFGDVVGSLTGTISDIVGALPSAVEQPAPVVNVTLPASGGGPPHRPASHGPVPRTNLNTESPRRGQTFTTRPHPGGGTEHRYPGGRTVVVGAPKKKRR